MKTKYFDIIIIGAGNAGLEAFSFLSKNYNVLLVTNNLDNIGLLSCNPSMGGIGKSNLIEEVDKLGGIIGKITDESSINFKNIKLNNIYFNRVQVDRNIYKYKMQNYIKNLKYISQETALKIIIKKNEIKGIITNYNNYKSKYLLITTGTFLNGVIHIGNKSFKGGRINEDNDCFISNQLKNFIPNSNRFKTGTSPRVNNRINFKNIKKQKSEIKNIRFYSKISKKKYIIKNCWLIKIKKNTIEIIKNNLKYSPLYNEIINGLGPRYCPSIEDKIYRFFKKSIYNLFLEPENIKFNEFYINGLSTSLPLNVQVKIIKSIKNLKKVNILKPGYTVEYDYFNPKNLKKSLESKIIKNLFMAGQINGTTGYEEASAQGIISAINISFKNKNKYWYPNKIKSYIGVMINDIIKGDITEPYRILKKNILNNNFKKTFFKYNSTWSAKCLNYLKLIKFYKNKIIPLINYNKIKSINFKTKENLKIFLPKFFFELISIKFKMYELKEIINFFKNY